MLTEHTSMRTVYYVCTEYVVLVWAHRLYVRESMKTKRVIDPHDARKPRDTCVPKKWIVA